MTLRIASSLLVATTLLAAPPDDKVEARRNALELAGAWTNDGFQLRDGHWAGIIEQGGSKFLRVNLFAGNHYWFTLAGLPAAKKCSVSVFDESGIPIEIDSLQDGSRAAAGFTPKISGPYIIKLHSIDGPRGDFAFVYSYR